MCAAVHCAQCGKIIKNLGDYETDIIKSSKKTTRDSVNSRSKGSLNGSRRGANHPHNDAKKSRNSQKTRSTRTRASRIMAHDDTRTFRTPTSTPAHTVGSAPVLAVERLKRLLKPGRLEDAIALIEAAGHRDPDVIRLILAWAQWESTAVREAGYA